MKYWPEYTTHNQRRHSLNHVQLLEYAISKCSQFRTAVQAGGNIGYWPSRMAQSFDKIFTFEPEPIMFECLVKNLAHLANVEARNEALGSDFGICSIERRSFGSHIVIPGNDIKIIPLDSLELSNLDLLQLDIEGYELYALQGGAKTIERCHPIIQLEIRGLSEQFGESDKVIFKFLAAHGYREIKRMLFDYVFANG